VDFLSELQRYSEKATHVQLELVSKDTPMIARFYAGEKVAHVPLTYQNDTVGVEEDYTFFVANRSEDKE
jgi:hypothetical protein